MIDFEQVNFSWEGLESIPAQCCISYRNLSFNCTANQTTGFHLKHWGEMGYDLN